MKTIIIASMDRNGTVGRTSKVCPNCNALDVRHLKSILGSLCKVCNGSDRVFANDVPWSYPEIDAHFERETEGHAVIRGRRAWESRRACCPTSVRKSIVVTSHPDTLPLDFVTYAPTLTSALAWLRTQTPVESDAAYARRVADARIYIAGGAKLFAAALPLADELDLTLIDREFDGDVKFPWSADATRAASDLNPWASYKLIRTHGVRFDLVEQRQGSTPELTFTRWCRK